MTPPPTVVLLGACGLERVAAPLRAATGAAVTVSGWTDTALVGRLDPALVVVDPFEWTAVMPLVAAALRGEDPRPLVGEIAAPRQAVLAALAGRRLVVRGLRRPPWGSLAPPPPTLTEALDALAAIAAGQRVLDVSALWARHGILGDGVRFGPGHGEPELGELGTSRLTGESAATVEARALHGLLRAATAGPRKVVVVDLDDTLVYGRIADDSFATRNPAWGGAGSAEEAWWRAPRGLHLALRELARRGLLLALCTRNDPAVVAARFWRRSVGGDPGVADPGAEGPVGAALQMLLDQSDFVAVEAGFGAKSSGCRRLAAGLGVGLDSLVFVDDSAVERAEVRQNAPGVLVLDHPIDQMPWRLLDHPELQVWAPSPAAPRRRASYGSRAAVTATPQADLDAFLRGLRIQATVRPATPADLPRVRELFARTNQLVLNGARPAPDSPEAVWVAQVQDRLADHGLVAAGLFSGPPQQRRLAAWACSCRVLPHRVAGSILSAMLREEPDADAVFEDTGRNGAAVGVVEEARGGAAPWVRLTP